MFTIKDLFPYRFNPAYEKPVTYLSMEFAVDQSLKIYSGGLGFLAGSHIRSAFELRQNFIGVGILWKYGYYDQERNRDGSMKVSYLEKNYSFLTDTGILFTITIHNHPVQVKVYLLKPEVFKTAPLFLLTTDIPENDHLAQTISYRLYDHHESARIAQSCLLGYGAAKLMDILQRETAVYHLNEGHGLPVCFHLWNKYNNLDEVKRRVVFTTHTPELAGNEEHDISRLEILSFFDGVEKEKYQQLIEGESHMLNYTVAALRMAGVANGVSRLHGQVAREMWQDYDRICNITSVTNAQNYAYWKDPILDKAFKKSNAKLIQSRKKELKAQLFQVVANQTGKLFDPNVLTIVWARRFAGYKRANLLLKNPERFRKIFANPDMPVQMIWAGKPYPEDIKSVEMFNEIHAFTKVFPNCTILTGYELGLSALLKRGSDVWLNNPRLYREASGTSGMTAAMNGSINFSIPDGWVPEFAVHGKNSFCVEPAERTLSQEEQDELEAERIYDMLEHVIVPMYYRKKGAWSAMTVRAWKDVVKGFESTILATTYYKELYKKLN